jgi:putative DNA primase/helicase
VRTEVKTGVDDLIARGATAEEIGALPRTPLKGRARPRPVMVGPSSKPTIVTNTYADWHDLLDEVFGALVAVNAPRPALFQRGLRLVRVRVDEDERPLIEPMTESSLKGQLAASLLWQRREGRGGMVPVQPPDAVTKNLLARSEWNGIPPLRDIIQSPVFTKDGAIITSTGYHASSRLWYAPSAGLRISVRPQPSEEIIRRARAFILDELLGEFPFTEAASRAHAVAAILLPFARELIEGPTPLHAFTAPTAGSGKGLLVELTSIIATGHPALPVSAPDSDEEMRKRITSQLRKGTPIIVLDNLNAKLESAALCAALTSDEWSDRVLGASEMTPALPNRALWICTANNPDFSLDVARRTVVVRIDSGEEHPWKRTFKHANIKAWAREHRSALVSAALTLIQGWLVAGRPAVEHPPIGSFEGWASVMAGVLGHAGIPGFLANYEAIFEQSSGETGEWADFVEEWWRLKGNESTYVRDLCSITKGSDLLVSVLGDGSEHSQRIRFGNALAQQKDRVYGGLQIRWDGRAKGGVRYHLGTAPRSGEEGV